MGYMEKGRKDRAEFYSLSIQLIQVGKEFGFV